MKMLLFLSMILSSIGYSSLKLRIATEGAYPPFNMKGPDGVLTGFDVDIAKALCAELKADCEIIAQAWDGMIPGLQSKRYDLIVASMSITEKRKKAVAFSRKYYQAGAIFVGKSGKVIETTQAGLKGKVIGVQRGATYFNYLKNVYGTSIEIKQYPTIDNHNLDLKAGRLDLVLGQRIVMHQWLQSPEGKGYQMYGKPIFHEQYLGEGAGIAMRKSDKKLLQQINQALETLIANGKYRQINQKYFPFSLLKEIH